MELYRKYRPATFARMVGNEQTVQALQEMVAKQSVPHAILFTGPSGCGKTTLARVLVNELGCTELDYNEINAANFRGVDTIREISRTMNLAPMGKARVWLFDEAHKMTNDAQNAMLKMLEDPPSHAYFLLCTTDPQKLIKTIRTRCCELAVTLLSDLQMGLVLRRVCKREKIDLTTEVMDKIIEQAQGSPRMALVILERLANLPAEAREAAIAAVVESETEAIELCRALLSKAPWPKVAAILRTLKGDPESVRWAVLMYARAVLLGKADHQAYLVIDCFKQPFYDSKEAGLVCACFEVVHAQK